MDNQEIIKRLAQAKLDKNVSFNYNVRLAELSKYSKSSSSMQKLRIFSNYDCGDYTKITFSGIGFNDNLLTVNEFISMMMAELFKDIKFYYKGKELEIKDIVLIDIPIIDTGAVVLLGDKERK